MNTADMPLKANKSIALAGNPNVGKSTVFNALTGMHQHTGNWAGKTVGNAFGSYRYEDRQYTLVDLPGTYSLFAHSKEEEFAGEYIKKGRQVVVDGRISISKWTDQAGEEIERFLIIANNVRLLGSKRDAEQQ